MLGPGSGRDFRTVGRAGAVGTELVVATLIGFFGGRWLDGKLGTEPWLALVGLLLGVAAGSKTLFQMARKAQREQSDETDDSDETQENP